MTAQAVLPLPGPTSDRGRRTATRIAAGVLAAAALVLGGVALRTAAASQQDSTLTAAQLDEALGITAAGSRALDRAPDGVVEIALGREATDSARVRASGMALGSEQHLGVVFTATDRAAADRLTTLLTRGTRFTVASTAPTAAQQHWTVGGITRAAPLTVAITHQLTERMSEAAWAADGATFHGWRVLAG